jgi:hypothetical protein
MAKKPVKVETLTHEGAARKNIPTAEYQSVAEHLEELHPREPAVYPRATPLAQGETRERNEDLDPQIIWNGARIRLTKAQARQLLEKGEVEIGDAQLVWRGKDRQDWSDLVVQTPPLYIQEKVHPKAIIDDLVRRTKAKARETTDAPDLFADFNGLDNPEKRTEFYQHDQHWSNRMILGDSLSVMASLAEREALRGKVQCIYFDPPYGIKFNSNWQVSTQSRDVKDGKQTDISREPEQVKAFRDTWKDGIHSYLTYLRDRLTVARDLLTESGSIFVQIGDENVHRVRAVMDEVFGAESCIVSITVEKTVPIRLKHTPTRCRVRPFSRIKRVECRRVDFAGDPEQRAEGVEGVKAPIEAEGELVEVSLQMLRADAVMSAAEPGLQVRKDEMDDGQKIFDDLWIAAFGDGVMVVAALPQARVAAPIVRNRERSRLNGALDKSAKLLGAPVGRDSEPDTAGVAPLLSRVLRGPRFTMPHFDGAGDEDFVMDASTLATRPSADPCLVHFDMLAGPTTDPVLVGPHHGRAELVENAKGGLVAREPELALELHGGHAGRLAGDEVSGPEPYAQRRMAALHGGPCRQPRLAAAFAACQDARPRGDAERFADFPAMRAGETHGPAGLFKIPGARRVVREKLLEFGEGFRKRKLGVVENVHRYNASSDRRQTTIYI